MYFAISDAIVAGNTTMNEARNMSAQCSKRKAKPLDVPDLEADPAERKRILNVLAQRRYRRKKREHLQNLERHVNAAVEEAPFPPDEPTIVDTDNTLFGYPLDGLDSLDNHIDLSCVPYEDVPLIDDTTFDFPLPSLSSPSDSSSSLSLSTGRRSRSRTPAAMSAFSRDELHMPSLEMNLMRGTMTIAKCLQVDMSIWQLDGQSPFFGAGVDQSFLHLPANLRPTLVQRITPHHPVFDVLPWPSVRDRLIMTFAQPEEIRPPNARSATAMLDFAYDFEHSAEGVRIYGDDPFSVENWEVGEQLFKNWWWALNSDVIARSNQLRRERGAKLLAAPRYVQELS